MTDTPTPLEPFAYDNGEPMTLADACQVGANVCFEEAKRERAGEFPADALETEAAMRMLQAECDRLNTLGRAPKPTPAEPNQMDSRTRVRNGKTERVSDCGNFWVPDRAPAEPMERFTKAAMELAKWWQEKRLENDLRGIHLEMLNAYRALTPEPGEEL